MSGTSVDAVDAVLIEIDRSSSLSTIARASLDFPLALRRQIQSLQHPGSDELERSARVALDLADVYAEAVQEVLRDAGIIARDITALGAHGQTVRHRPNAGFTIQLLNAARLAESTGIPVVHDFRPADVAAGGQGAPLVPAFHAHVFASRTRSRAIVNIGGIANVSVLPASDRAGALQVLGHDTGPGNTLLDQWHERHQQASFDRGGEWAASGNVDRRLLDSMLSDDYFAIRPPKSTGRDHFNLEWLDSHLARHPGPAPTPRDVQASLAELTAQTIARDCRSAGVDEVYLCGGGVFNQDLVRRIAEHLPGVALASTEALGIAPMAVEAAAFGWLAARRIDRLPGNLPAVTGASGERILGTLSDPLGRLSV